MCTFASEIDSNNRVDRNDKIFVWDVKTLHRIVGLNSKNKITKIKSLRFVGKSSLIVKHETGVSVFMLYTNAEEMEIPNLQKCDNLMMFRNINGNLLLSLDSSEFYLIETRSNLIRKHYQLNEKFRPIYYLEDNWAICQSYRFFLAEENEMMRINIMSSSEEEDEARESFKPQKNTSLTLFVILLFEDKSETENHFRGDDQNVFSLDQLKSVKSVNKSFSLDENPQPKKLVLFQTDKKVSCHTCYEESDKYSSDIGFSKMRSKEKTPSSNSSNMKEYNLLIGFRSLQILKIAFKINSLTNEVQMLKSEIYFEKNPTLLLDLKISKTMDKGRSYSQIKRRVDSDHKTMNYENLDSHDTPNSTLPQNNSDADKNEKDTNTIFAGKEKIDETNVGPESHHRDSDVGIIKVLRKNSFESRNAHFDDLHYSTKQGKAIFIYRLHHRGQQTLFISVYDSYTEQNTWKRINLKKKRKVNDKDRFRIRKMEDQYMKGKIFGKKYFLFGRLGIITILIHQNESAKISPLHHLTFKNYFDVEAYYSQKNHFFIIKMDSKIEIRGPTLSYCLHNLKTNFTFDNIFYNEPLNSLVVYTENTYCLVFLMV